MFDEVQIVQMPLAARSVRKRVESFLNANGLEYEPLDYYAGVFEGDRMLAGGGFSGNVIKCVAVTPQARYLNLTGKLISHLRAECTARGAGNIFIFTKPSNEEIFKSLAFYVVGRGKDAMLLESDPRGISSFCESLASVAKSGRNGCIVMNCNPLTLGHRYLIERVSREVDNLYVLIVSENKSYFTTGERLAMAREGVKDLENVTVLEGGSYVISSATFPRYFIKSEDKVSLAQMELDLNIFTTHIALALNIEVRFVGTEPYDPMTRSYNAMMRLILPPNGVEVREVERKSENNRYISATEVRKAIESLRLTDALKLVPDTSALYIKSKFAEALSRLASDALVEELETTPKPGLVDKEDSGAHTDMNFGMMSRSIKVLEPYFAKMALAGINGEGASDIRRIGIEAERAMLDDTGRVNTYRGAIFSLGLCIFSVAVLASRGESITSMSLSAAISRTALNFEKQSVSNGSAAAAKYGLKGALRCAQEGYPLVFDTALPYYRELAGGDSDTANLKTLLKIMSLLDDTNIYHRAGAERAAEVKTQAVKLLGNFSKERIREMNRTFIRDNISPGGSADMLAMTLLIDKIITKQ